tara:strand:- start:207 stop:602 length:396 start_codon:yes stop_codon:yes gene_type:complete
MNVANEIRVRDISEAWYERLLADNLGAAEAKVAELLEDTERDSHGCLVTNTEQPRKVRFLGCQDRAYRFVYCIRNRVATNRHQVVRHRCHNRRCINPNHLEIGDRRDNLNDERDRQANGVDWRAIEAVAMR